MAEGYCKERNLFFLELDALIRQSNKVLLANQVEPYLRDFDVYKSKMDSIASRISEFITDCEELKLRVDEMFEKRHELNQAISRLETIRDASLPPISPMTASSNSNPMYSAPALPNLQFPTFNGEVKEWLEFSSRFRDCVKNYPQLTEGQKFSYLINSLSGTAKNAVSNISCSEASFKEAWEILQEKYENLKELAVTLAGTILNHSPATNARDLESLIDTVRQVIRGAKIIGFKEEIPDWFMYPILISKLDRRTLEDWERAPENDPKRLPSREIFLQFLERQMKLMRCSFSLPSNSHEGAYAQRNRIKREDNTNKQGGGKCLECQMLHPLWRCPVFVRASLDDRWAIVIKHNLCYNCFSPKHASKDCLSSTCMKCAKPHNRLLHKEQTEGIPTRTITNTMISNPPQHGSDMNRAILLSTALVRIVNESNETIVIRVLLDNASTVSYLHSSVIKKLNLPYHKQLVTLNTITGSQTEEQKVTRAKIESCTQKYSHVSQFYVTEKRLVLPTENVKMNYREFEKLTLADPDFFNQKPIEGLLGMDLLCEIMELNAPIPIAGMIASQTKLGWIVCGKLQYEQNSKSQVTMTTIQHPTTMNRFWELEEVPEHKSMTPEQQKTEECFRKTTQILPCGRFQVKMPLKQEPPNIGDSRAMAVVRLKSLHKKFECNSMFAQVYRETIQDYIDKGHMVQVPRSALFNHAAYLPHHGVLSASRTTKLRIVFDASVKTTNGQSLNSQTLDAPKTQDDLKCILIRYRSYPVALTGDIFQMYRQINLDPSQWDFQRILWRFTENDPILEYYLTTVTWGTKSAPYLSTKVVNEISTVHSKEYPSTTRKIRNDIYIDDILSGCQTSQEAIELWKNLTYIFSSHGFRLHKWASNKPSVMAAIPKESHAPSVQILKDNEDCNTKTLGIEWNIRSDQFHFSYNPIKITKLTKRTILSATNSIFDPLGWLAPVLLRPKLFIQQLWRRETIGWDTELNSNDIREWQNITDDLPNIKHLYLNRCILPEGCEKAMLCGFSDASEKAYSAVVYTRTIVNNHVVVNLVAAKTRLSPLTPMTIPRLELCGALLLARLIQCIQGSLNVTLPVMAWTDSMVTLGWLKAHASKWKTFVANRVHEIQQIVPAEGWNHIPGECNPADCASRGTSSKELRENSLWWSGPDVLYKNDLSEGQGKTSNVCIPEPIEERKHPEKQIVTAVTIPILSNISSPATIININAYVIRFINNCKSKVGNRKSGLLTADDINHAEKMTWRMLQREAFHIEYRALQEKRSLPTGSRLVSLNPYLDEDGIMRVGGRLARAKMTTNKKHPIILPPKHPLTLVILRDLHIKYLHAGNQLLTTLLQNKFWLPNARKIIKSVLRKCTRCIRLKAETNQQMMADLPFNRVNPSRPFTHTGVDFTGAINLRNKIARGSKQYKAYISIFICLSTRAIHIELVSGLDADSFLAAFQRFVSRRGLVSSMHSDCGVNFTAANKILVASFKNNQKIHQQLAQQQIKWHFHPPGAPHFSGLWEAGVKSIKYHLIRVVGETVLTFEEMTTVLAKIEACLNSRPLTAVCSDPEDYQALTPAHFLIGGPLHAIPEETVEEPVPPLKRWLLTQRITQHFWRRWSGEYLSRLQHRPKWTKPSPNLSLNQLVIIKEENVPPLQWRLGRVTEIHPGADGLVRVATVKTQHRNFQRPVVKLVPLPLD